MSCCFLQANRVEYPATDSSSSSSVEGRWAAEKEYDSSDHRGPLPRPREAYQLSRGSFRVQYRSASKERTLRDQAKHHSAGKRQLYVRGNNMHEGLPSISQSLHSPKTASRARGLTAGESGVRNSEKSINRSKYSNRELISLPRASTFFEEVNLSSDRSRKRQELPEWIKFKLIHLNLTPVRCTPPEDLIPPSVYPEEEHLSLFKSFDINRVMYAVPDRTLTKEPKSRHRYPAKQGFLK